MASSTSASGATGPVDRARLAALRDEVGEHTMRRFITTYLDLLEARLERIAEPLEPGRADSLRAAFDLRVSSEMLGAARLAGIAADVEATLREGTLPGARQRMALHREADSVAAALFGMLKAKGSGGR
jgi:HPt (histidine-containing phosphotransfer) domain-containing protein